MSWFYENLIRYNFYKIWCNYISFNEQNFSPFNLDNIFKVNILNVYFVYFINIILDDIIKIMGKNNSR